MKYLQDYQEEEQSKFLKDNGCFFAFSEAQFKEQSQQGVQYANIGAGLLCPKDKVKIVINGLNDIHKRAIQKDIEENGEKAIILRELYNYECFYTGDYQPVLAPLKAYKFTETQISTIFYQEQGSSS